MCRQGLDFRVHGRRKHRLEPVFANDARSDGAEIGSLVDRLGHGSTISRRLARNERRDRY
jgi:hypothetical protein